MDARGWVLAAVMVLATACAPPWARIKPRPEVLTGAFTDGYVGQADGLKRYPLRTLRLGEVSLPSGRLVLADPFVASGREDPIDLRFSPGRYPVDVVVADAGDGGQRVALARLKLSDAAPVRWAMAVTAKQDVATLRGADIFGYGVDAGIGGFLDAGSAAWIKGVELEVRETITNDWQRRGEAQAERRGVPYGLLLIEPVGPGEIAMFASGWGDGSYASWVGYDAGGRPAQVVTDFGVIWAVTLPGRW